MANNKYDEQMKSLLGKRVYDKLGKFLEGTGGGDPIPAGKTASNFHMIVADNPEEAQEMRAEHEGEKDVKVRVRQPRNNDGTFAYNSSNKRGLKYKSRGKYDATFLEGWLPKWYKDAEGKLHIMSEDGQTIMVSDMSEKEFKERCKYYIEGEGRMSFMDEGSETTSTVEKSERTDKDIKSAQTDREIKEQKKFEGGKRSYGKLGERPAEKGLSGTYAPEKIGEKWGVQAEGRDVYSYKLYSKDDKTELARISKAAGGEGALKAIKQYLSENLENIGTYKDVMKLINQSNYSDEKIKGLAEAAKKYLEARQ